MTKPAIKLEAILLSILLVLIGFGLGYMTGWLRLKPVDESSLVFASFDTETAKNEKIYGRDVLQKISGPLEQMERSKYELKRRTTEEMIRARLAPATPAASVEPSTVEEAAGEVTKAELAAFLKERNLDPSRLSARQLHDITISLGLHKKNAERRSNEDLLFSKANVHWKIPLPPIPTIDLEGGLASAQNKGATVKVVVVSNLNCPTCKVANQRVEELKAKYKDKLEIAYRFVISEPDGSIARLTAEAALCANDQKKFWEFHDQALAAQPQTPADFMTIAKTIGVDLPKFEACTSKREFKDKLEEESDKSKKAGVAEAPMILIEGHALHGASSVDYFSQVIDFRL